MVAECAVRVSWRKPIWEGRIYKLISESLGEIRIAVGAIDWPTDITGFWWCYVLTETTLVLLNQAGDGVAAWRRGTEFRHQYPSN